MRRRKRITRNMNVGQVPGSLRKTDSSTPVSIYCYRYNGSQFEEQHASGIKDLTSSPADGMTSWINVNGVHNSDLLQEMGERFSVHPLVLEDIQHTTQRPKLERFDEYLFMTFKMLQYDEDLQDITSEQVSVVLGHGYLLSFQEIEGDVFESIRARLRGKKGRIRNAEADYLAYSLIDSVVDQYFSILEKMEDHIDTLENQILSQGGTNPMAEIHNLKRQLIFLRRAVWPLREMVNALEKDEGQFIRDETKPYLRDVYEHAVQVIDAVEAIRDISSGLHDIYLSTVSNSMNVVMKVLTIIATIFIPLTFVAGIYGMNFQYMPELAWRWGYPAAIGIMLLVAMGMVIYFKRKKWF